MKTAQLMAVEMPPGDYFLGDPCYAIEGQEQWMKWLVAARYDEVPNPRILLADVDERPVVGVGTAFGDGTYLDESRRAYPVDSGLIGAVPVELVEDGKPWGMHLVSFSEPFRVEFDGNFIHIGFVSIDTDPKIDEWSGEEEC